MSGDRDRLIRGLVADLRPVRRPGRVDHWLVAWLLLAVLFSVAALAATGRYRAGAFDALSTLPGFAAETLIAVMAVTLLARATLRSSIPGAGRYLAWPTILLATWVGFYFVGLWFPAHPVTTLGYRAHCLAQTQMVAFVNLFALLCIARRLAPLRPRLTGMLAGAAAAAVPAALMQFACKYDPEHILLYHLAPLAATALIGAVLGPLLLVRRSRPLPDFEP